MFMFTELMNSSDTFSSSELMRSLHKEIAKHIAKNYIKWEYKYTQKCNDKFIKNI